jgi:ParB-like chromosome segregation protein Spo0J
VTTVEDQLPHTAEAETSTESRQAKDLRALCKFWFADKPLPERVALLNELRGVLREFSPFKDEPVDLVEWVPGGVVHANDYNPNTVAPPEMELLRVSINHDGFTQPIVTMPEDDKRVVIDGFHRHRVGKEMPDVNARIHGHLPVVRIRQDREDRNDRIASTIRHNRARGKHRVDAMSDIVVELKSRNWPDERIARELGMEADEVLRLCQMSGLAELFSDEEFSASWDVIDPADDFEGIDGEFPQQETADADGPGRIYHTWDKWEAFAAGFFDTKPTNQSLTAARMKEMYADFLRDITRFEMAMDGVLRDWPNSTEHNLSNERMNRIAWLGQAAMCWDTGVPATFCNGYMLLTTEEQERANLAALGYLNKWLAANGRPTLATLKDAARTTQPELY